MSTLNSAQILRTFPGMFRKIDSPFVASKVLTHRIDPNGVCLCLHLWCCSPTLVLTITIFKWIFFIVIVIVKWLILGMHPRLLGYKVDSPPSTRSDQVLTRWVTLFGGRGEPHASSERNGGNDAQSLGNRPWSVLRHLPSLCPMDGEALHRPGFVCVCD